MDIAFYGWNSALLNPLPGTAASPNENKEKSSKSNSEGTQNTGGSQQNSGNSAGKPVRGAPVCFMVEFSVTACYWNWYYPLLRDDVFKALSCSTQFQSSATEKGNATNFNDSISKRGQQSSTPHIRNMQKQFDNSVSRDGNQVADGMAKITRDTELEVDIYSAPPGFILPLLHGDVSG
ncbi:hypothetical protein V6N13_100981 [Hibiscus sabdariffa]